MSNKPHVFKDRDVRRLVKAVRATGEPVARIEFDPHTGKIAVITGESGNGTDAAPDEVSGDLRQLI